MSYQLRKYQQEAINSLKKNLQQGVNRPVIQMVTGSGITMTCFAALSELKNNYSWKKISIVTDRRVLVEQMIYVKNKFWVDSFEKDSLDILTNRSFSKSKNQYDAIVLFNIRDNNKILIEILKDFRGPIIIFSQTIDENYNVQYKELDPILIFRYTLQNAINEVPEILKDDILIKIKTSVKNIIKEITIDNNKLTVDQLQRLAIESRIVIRDLEQLSYDYSENKNFVSEVLANNITLSEIKKIGYRKDQLKVFNRLLNDDIFFESEKEKLQGGSELVWQTFFEKNDWILGYGMNQIFHSSLDDKKLEQTLAGYNLDSSGKKVDALMKSKGIIENLCFIELKTHVTPLLNKKPYRAECFQPSFEMSGAISQVQKTVYKTLRSIKERLEINDKNGDPTGETIFSYNPKSYLVIGNLKEFETPNGINLAKYSSFELFRKSIANVDIITFDELYEKAKFIALYE